MSELLFGDSKTALQHLRAVAAGRERKLARGLFTTDLRADPASLIRRYWLDVLGHYFPNAVVTDRSAITRLPEARGEVFVVHPRARQLKLPGLWVLPRSGPGPLAGDTPLPQRVFFGSRERGLLENLKPSRAVEGHAPRTLSRKELHAWVARLLQSEGPQGLNAIRDRARSLALNLGLRDQFTELDEIIGAALGTHVVATTDDGLKAAQRGLPYDEARDKLFGILSAFLEERAPSVRTALEADRPRRAVLPFFEAYFSTFIEGTEFTVDEAAKIVFEGQIPSARPEDAHDVLGTYQLVSSLEEMRRRPRDAADFLGLLRRRHGVILEGRPQLGPGQFKTIANRVGRTEFVAPDLVEGTLTRGFEHLPRLSDPFARAVMMAFVVAEVHPFLDGNGRASRVMMNAELEAAGEQRIVIPPVFREEYLSGLRALTHNGQPAALVKVLDFAQRYTAQVNWSTLDLARADLEATHAFLEPREAEDRGLRLMLPSKLSR